VKGYEQVLARSRASSHLKNKMTNNLPQGGSPGEAPQDILSASGGPGGGAPDLYLRIGISE